MNSVTSDGMFGNEVYNRVLDEMRLTPKQLIKLRAAVALRSARKYRQYSIVSDLALFCDIMDLLACGCGCGARLPHLHDDGNASAQAALALFSQCAH